MVFFRNRANLKNMKAHLILIMLLASCARIPTPFKRDIQFIAPDSAKQPLKVVRREFWQIQGAENILQNAKAATISIWIYPTGDIEEAQNVIGISVGEKRMPHYSTRASIRVYPGGKLFAVARAGDREPEQNIATKAVLEKNKWQHVLLTIDYPKDEMRFYLNGDLLPIKGIVDFQASKTSNTPSRTVVLGAEDDGSIQPFVGQIKDVGVWRRKLTSEEITVLAKKLKPGESLMFGM